MCFYRKNYYYCLVGLYYINNFVEKCNELDIEIVYSTDNDVIIHTYPSLSRLMKQYGYIQKIKNPFSWESNLNLDIYNKILFK